MAGPWSMTRTGPSRRVNSSIDHIGDGGRIVHVAAIEADALGIEAQVEAAHRPQEAARLTCVIPQCIQVGAAEEALLGHVQPDDHHGPGAVNTRSAASGSS